MPMRNNPNSFNTAMVGNFVNPSMYKAWIIIGFATFVGDNGPETFPMDEKDPEVDVAPRLKKLQRIRYAPVVVARILLLPI